VAICEGSSRVVRNAALEYARSLLQHQNSNDIALVVRSYKPQMVVCWKKVPIKKFPH
jgi:3-deoxy-D-arabino-heptulosonate 7-phosphate (DAHP) synthase